MSYSVFFFCYNELEDRRLTSYEMFVYSMFYVTFIKVLIIIVYDMTRNNYLSLGAEIFELM